MDEFCKQHLENWLEHVFYEDEREQARAQIMRAINDDPTLLAPGTFFSWKEIYSAGVK